MIPRDVQEANLRLVAAARNGDMGMSIKRHESRKDSPAAFYASGAAKKSTVRSVMTREQLMGAAVTLMDSDPFRKWRSSEIVKALKHPANVICPVLYGAWCQGLIEREGSVHNYAYSALKGRE